MNGVVFRLCCRFWRWLHCLTHLHRGVTLDVNGRVIYIGCECGYVAFGNKETADAVMAYLRATERS